MWRANCDGGLGGGLNSDNTLRRTQYSPASLDSVSVTPITSPVINLRYQAITLKCPAQGQMSVMAIFQQQSEKRQTKSHSLNVRAQPVAHEMPCYKRVTSITDSGTTLRYRE